MFLVEATFWDGRKIRIKTQLADTAIHSAVRCYASGQFAIIELFQLRSNGQKEYKIREYV